MQDIEKIYEEHFETVNKFLFCLTHNDDISEELTQETFYRAVKKIDTYKGECKISVWLCQIAKNLWHDECRKNKKINAQEKELLSIPILETLESQVIANEEKIALLEIGKQKFWLDESDFGVVPISYLSIHSWENLFTAVTSNVDKIKLGEKECYIVRDGNTEKFIDVETGIVLKLVDNTNNITVDYKYEYGTVKSTDIIKPDTMGYIKNK